ncbi:hypothetical protein CUMW_243700, partial [Citrus unshiu]
PLPLLFLRRNRCCSDSVQLLLLRLCSLGYALALSDLCSLGSSSTATSLSLAAGSLILPDKFTLPFVIKSCAGLLCPSLGKQIHAHVCKFGLKSHSITENALLDLYGKCDELIEAHKVFEEMTDRDIVAWNDLISGYARLGQMKKARMLFDKMPYTTIVSWTAMISGYTHRELC